MNKTEIVYWLEDFNDVHDPRRDIIFYDIEKDEVIKVFEKMKGGVKKKPLCFKNNLVIHAITYAARHS